MESTNQINDQGNTPSNAKNNVAYRSIDVIDNSESEHNNTDEESIDLDENGKDSDDADNLTNSINRLSIENSKNTESNEKGDKEISDVTYDGSKLQNIKAFAKCQPSGFEHWKQVQIMPRGGKAMGKYQSYLNTRNLENRTTHRIDWSKIEKWRPINTMEDVLISESNIPKDIYCTKIDELKKWKENDVYEPVEFIGQNTISTR